jgi:hypothetical protein
MTNAMTLSGDFEVTRAGKGGRKTTRTALGVITSGNAKERAALSGAAVEYMLENGNFRHAMREVQRVFPVSTLKKSCLVLVDGGTVFIRREFIEGGVARLELEQIGSWIAANKAAMVAMATIVERLALDAALAGKPLKGEKALYAGFLDAFMQRETQRQIAALAKVEAAKVEAAKVEATEAVEG